jgi:hypothetical protein
MTLTVDQFTHKYRLEEMTSEELSVMRLFLQSERDRHQDDINDINRILQWIDRNEPD